MPLVNMREMARLLSISLPTMRELLERHPDLPVVGRGGAGVQWQFDADEVIAFMRVVREQKAAADAERSEQLASLPLLDSEMRSQSEMGLSSKDYGQEIRNARDLDKLRVERGFLIDKSQMRMLLDQSWRLLANSLNALPSQIGRKHNLPEAVVRDMRKYLHEQQVATHARLAEYLAPELRQGEEEMDDEPDQAPSAALC